MSNFSSKICGCSLITVQIAFLVLGIFPFFGKSTFSYLGQEREALLEFKSSLSDPFGILSDWAGPGSGLEHCSWRGVVCGPDSRVSSIRIIGGNCNCNCNCNDNGGYGCDRCCKNRCFNVVGIKKGKLGGRLPVSIGKLEKIRVLSLPFHEFTGEIPDEIWGLKGLEVLDLEGNLLSGQLPVSVPVSGLRRLRVLNLGMNRIGGTIPGLFSGLVGLEVLSLAGNELEGSIPGLVGGYRRLRRLDLSSNRLNGELPDVWGRGCQNLRYLDLSGNGLSGSILTSFGSCRELQVLLLYSNDLRGVIPRELGRLTKLEVLDVSRNKLAGNVPAELGNCQELSVLVLSDWDESLSADGKMSGGSGTVENNLFQGSIPVEITALPKLRMIWAPKAGLEGDVPSNWGRCDSLEMINLSHNFFTGAADGVFDGCKHLLYVDVSLITYSACNSLPVWMSNSHQLNRASSAYVSFFVNRACTRASSFLSKAKFGENNNLVITPTKVRRPASSRFLSEFNPSSDQAMPSSSVQSNAEDLQANAETPSDGGSNYGNKLNSIEIASVVSASVIVLVLLALVVLFIYTRKCAPRDSSRVQVYERREIKVFNDIGVPLTFQNVVKATDCFTAGKCIGCGGFGATYKAEISPGVMVAVKRLAVGRFHCIQQFHAEIKTLGRIRHPNLVTLVGYHASETEMFLIYNYLPGGNLEKFIQERTIKAIKWKVLHKIALDVAHAIAYLHDECNPRVIHRDVKPSNILLDNDYNAYLSDFGLSRLLENSETHATTGVAGTFGYLAPEYAMTCRVSEKADVYSYGVVLLELISDKKALDPSFSSHGNGFNIVSWAHMLLRQGRAKEVFTAGIWDSGPHDDLVEVLHLAVKCTVDSLSIRPTMKQVVQLLKQVRPLS